MLLTLLQSMSVWGWGAQVSVGVGWATTMTMGMIAPVRGVIWLQMSCSGLSITFGTSGRTWCVIAAVSLPNVCVQSV